MQTVALKSLAVAMLAAAGMSAGSRASCPHLDAECAGHGHRQLELSRHPAQSLSPSAPSTSTRRPARTLAAQGQVTVTCNKGAAVALTVGNGLHGTWNMLNGGNSDTLAYTLKMPTSFTTCPAAGSGSNWTSVDMAPAYASSGGAQDLAICGQVATPQLGRAPAVTPTPWW